VPVTKDVVKDAPRLDVDETMTEFQERELCSYYGYDYAGTSGFRQYGYGTTYSQARADEGFSPEWDSSWLPRRERLRRDDRLAGQTSQ
jgi:hypothetical protein